MKIAGWMLGGFLLVLGFVVAIAGCWLLALGGSAYYLPGGIVVALSGYMTIKGRIAGPLLYGIFILATIVWALFETGLDGWALVPRLLAPALIGLVFLLLIRRFMVGQRRCLLYASLPVAAGAASLVLLMALAMTDPVQHQSQWQKAWKKVAANAPPANWSAYGGDWRGQRYSGLEQIRPDNVAALQPAWTFHTGIAPDSAFETTPIIADDSLVFCTQTNEVIALDPDTGTQKWRFDPKVSREGANPVTTCRGVSLYHAANDADCPDRIVTTTFDARLLAINARTGKLCTGFGEEGTVDLKAGMGEVKAGYYYGSAAPTVAGSRIIIGGYVIDNQSVDVPSGVVRAFDADTGAFAWAWDIGRPGKSGEPVPPETYSRSTPNAWAQFSADTDLGIVYVPTGNAAPDYWGGRRSANDDKYSSSLVALDIADGSVKWSFQTTHHDIWDYDIPSQPSLIDIPGPEGSILAVMQTTKRGEIFLLDRRNGKPIAAVEERKVPTDGIVPDERISPTQPFSVGMPSFGRTLQERDMWGATPLDQLWCRLRFKTIRYEGPMTPPGLKTSLFFPSAGGGMNWGGAAIDAERGIAVVNTIQYGTTIRLVPRLEADKLIAAAGSHSFDAPQAQAGAPYASWPKGFDSPLGVPCTEPPFGEIAAIDLATKATIWRRPLGSARDSGLFNIPSGLKITMGVPNLGGSLITRSGLVFIGATQEAAFRAFDLITGKELWYSRLPAGGQANPMTYVSPKSGRQFVVIAAGGSALVRSKGGDGLHAFALPTAK